MFLGVLLIIIVFFFLFSSDVCTFSFSKFTYKTKEKQTKSRKLFEWIRFKRFPLLWWSMFVERFLRYVCLWPPICSSNGDPKYFYDHDLISIW